MGIDRSALRQAISVALPEPEVRATATAEISLELIDLRLRTLKDKTDGASWRELKYLEELRKKRFPKAL